MKTHQDNVKKYPGQIWAAEKNLELLEDRDTIRLIVVNRGDRPVQVGSHFHFFEVNKYLDFDRRSAYGMRLAIPAGTAVRFEPGMSLDVRLIGLKGERCCYGLNGLVTGSLDDENNKARAFQEAAKRGFKGVANGN